MMDDFSNLRMKKEKELVKSIIENEEKIRELYKRCSHTSRFQEDRIYRFYHRSFKVYDLQTQTIEIVTELRRLMSYELTELNSLFQEIYISGTSKEFDKSSNSGKEYETKPILEAYFHAEYILHMVVKYGLDSSEKQREGNPGWFTVLYFYNIR